MSLDFTLVDPTATYDSEDLFWKNITHNLGKMAQKAGIYEMLWRPEELGVTKAKEIIESLEIGLNDMIKRPEYYKQFDSPNGWGTYSHFVPFVSDVLNACKEYPEAIIEISR